VLRVGRPLGHVACNVEPSTQGDRQSPLHAGDQSTRTVRAVYSIVLGAIAAHTNDFHRIPCDRDTPLVRRQASSIHLTIFKYKNMIISHR
jgi:hypothetical protein